jgi:hypothetical protein
MRGWRGWRGRSCLAVFKLARVVVSHATKYEESGRSGATVVWSMNWSID